MSFGVEMSPTAEAELERLFEFLLDRCETSEGIDRTQAAIDEIRATAQHRLAITPFSFRKAAQSPAKRELVIPFGGAGTTKGWPSSPIGPVAVLRPTAGPLPA